MTRIDALIADMTLAEKIGQLVMVTAGQATTGPVAASDPVALLREGRVGSLLNLWGAAETRAMQRIAVNESRLGIPLFFGFDVIHGHRTIFPIPLGEAAAFDADLWEATARTAAEEASAEGVDLTFAPMLDVCRDPRWGRIAEGPGEDPLVTVRMAEAKVRGFQGDALSDPRSVAATAKHFAAYGAPTAGRDYASVDVSERTLCEVYLPPFEAAVRSGAAAIMPAFNDVAGVPMTAHVPLLRDWLRGRLGFEGVVISDYNAIAELIAHGVADDLAEAASLALTAGVDIDMMSLAYAQGLPEALARGLVTEAQIDASVRRVLVLKERLGLFDDPFRRQSSQAGVVASARRERAREAARRAIVLLKNDGPLLPLARSYERIALVGPLADARSDMLGPWAGAGGPAAAVTILEGLRATLPDCRIDVAADAAALGETDINAAEFVILCLGETARMSGEAASRAEPGLPDDQRALAERVLASGRPAVALLSSGRPLVAPWLFEAASCVLATWFLGTQAGHAIADILFGRADATGRLPVTWPRAIGQIPIFAGQRPSGRPANPKDPYTSTYLDCPVEPQFAFGHGLSFSGIVITGVEAEPGTVRRGGRVTVTVGLDNRGGRGGEETVFLFLRDPVASVARPVLELKDFARIGLAPGDRGVLRFRLDEAAFAFPGSDLEPVVEPGAFEICVGTSADPACLRRVTIRFEG
ncbi:glycoside hydrolase family 3 N-terminal domain-containing protein [Amorphus coralli]|uniref:glycoside hydrolase family 3 N-terminal domain-containing protein n=1 Tax=Amorphus coralli TaxID=340680 RepID=UPI00036FCE2A|nr:glycoside hydrolase family 3 N-terminal domain-containing protein [Amorphus coralli]